MAAQLKKLFVKFADYKAHAGKAVAVLVQVLHKTYLYEKGCFLWCRNHVKKEKLCAEQS